MKAYTDIAQSKRLAEILPLESADMEYLTINETGSFIGTVPFVKDDSEVEDSAYSHTYNRIACWSLAALLSVLPTLDDRNAEFCKDIRFVVNTPVYYYDYRHAVEDFKNYMKG